jgi:RimJ/RimL family protein N-acetyltransferase
VVRELRPSDAAPLHAIATLDEVASNSWPPPPTPDAVRAFIRWARRERRVGRYLGFAIVARPTGELGGMIELRRAQSDFFRAEIGFFIAPKFWGSGLFRDAASLVLDFAFSIGAYRIEARTDVSNGRGNSALEKIGFRHEGVLREAFVCNGEYTDENLWALSRRGWEK